MPKFAVISPTHVSGKKKEAWENFRNGGYIAICSIVCQDLSEESIDEIKKIASIEYDKFFEGKKGTGPRGVHIFESFFSLEVGDYVAVNNTNDGLFGIGIIASPYYYKENAHNTGSTDPKRFYSHFLNVKWIVTSYIKKSDIKKSSDEKWWPPYGTIHVFSEVPEYIERIISEKSGSPVVGVLNNQGNKKDIQLVAYERPDWLLNLINDIEKLKRDAEHKERAHESLVESFYELLGFEKYTDIKHRQGRIDIVVEYENRKIIVNEVKKDWHLSWKDKKTLSQAYNYAHEIGARYVVLTNGDYYAIFDRQKGHSYESQFVGDFKLSEFRPEYLDLLRNLKKENLPKN